MTIAATLSTTAAALELLVGGLCLGFARAPGWGRLRGFALVALTAAAYSLSSVPQTLTGAPAVIVPASQLSILAGALHALAWLHYSAGHGGGRPTAWTGRALGGLLALVAALAAWPGVLARATVHSHDVPALALRYHTADATPLGEAAFLVALLAMLLPAWRYLRGLLAGVPGSWPHLLGFAALLAASVAEALTAAQLLAAPYLLDVGFLAATLTIGVELVRRVTGDGERLTALSARLERTVEERTAALARAHAALAQQERLVAMGRLAGGVAHQVNSPLAAITANARYVLEELHQAQAHPAAPELREATVEIAEAARRIRDLVVDLQLFARGPDGTGEDRAEVRPAIASAVRLMRHELGDAGVVALEGDPVPQVAADPARLAQVLISLLENAARALPRGRREPGAVVVRTSEVDGQVLIEVEDRGEGMSGEQLERAVEPFFTTRAAEGAAGLGLSVSHGLIQAMGGRLELSSQPGRGTLARVWLPAAGVSEPPRRSDRSGA
jgi:signal transduction histidine kinase